MKRTFLIYLLLLLTQGYYTRVWAETKYVDLGLPSGTKWAVENEGREYTFYEAYDLYPRQLPTKEQFEELISECDYSTDGEKIYFVGITGDTLSFSFGTYHYIPKKFTKFCDNTSIFLYAYYCRKGHSDILMRGYMPTGYEAEYLPGCKPPKHKSKNDKYQIIMNSSYSYSGTASYPSNIRLVEQTKPVAFGKPANHSVHMTFKRANVFWYAYDKEGEYSYHDLERATFRDSLPTWREWNELLSESKWEWTGRGYRVTNGKHQLFFPLRSDDIHLDSTDLFTYIHNSYLFHPYLQDSLPNIPDTCKFKARLVSPSSPVILREYRAFVDLGLPSGTLWHSYDIDQEHTWDEAFEAYGAHLPTREQYNELVSYCTFETLSVKSKNDFWWSSRNALLVTGPNGKQIILLAPTQWTQEQVAGKSWGAYAFSADFLQDMQTYYITSKEEQLGVHLVR